MTPGDSRDGDGQEETPEAGQALRWLQRSRAEDELLALVAQRVRRRRQRRQGLVATLAVALAAFGVSWQTRPEAVTEHVAEAEVTPTAIVTTPRREILADGTAVDFKDGAAISTQFTDGLRRVTLLRGEAHFDVAKDPARPFIVTAQGVEVRAVGTAFSVQLDVATVEVLVTEGRVALGSALPETPVDEAPSVAAAVAPVLAASSREADPFTNAAAILDAGHRASIRLGERAPEVTPLASDEMVKRLSWRVPQLEFSRTRLAEIIELMNRHAAARGNRQIMIDEQSLGLAELKLSGFLAADNTEGLVRLLETNFRVKAVVSADSIRLHRPY